MTTTEPLSVCKATDQYLVPHRDNSLLFLHNDGTECAHPMEQVDSEWSVYHTGGGCMALIKTEADGKSYWLITDIDGPGLPTRGKAAALGKYDDEEGLSEGTWKVEKFTTPEEAFASREGLEFLGVEW